MNRILKPMVGLLFTKPLRAFAVVNLFGPLFLVPTLVADKQSSLGARNWFGLLAVLALVNGNLFILFWWIGIAGHSRRMSTATERDALVLDFRLDV